MSVWRRPIRQLVADASRALFASRQPATVSTRVYTPAEWRSVEFSHVTPQPQPQQNTIFPHRLRERTLDTPPGAVWDGYRSLSWKQRDLAPITYDLMVSGVEWLWGSSPIARRAMEIQRDFVISEGVKFKPKTQNPEWAKRIMAVVNKHWADKRNGWAERLGQRVMEIGLFGELSLHARRRKSDGRVRLGVIIPELVAKIEAAPLDAEDLQWIVLKQPVIVGVDAKGQEVKRDRFRIVHECEDVTSAEDPDGELFGDGHTPFLDGEVFHIGINRLSTASRGISDLLPIIDWLDLFHQLLHSEVDRAMMLKAFLWDVLVEDPKPGEVQEILDRNKVPPPPGSVNVHSAKEKWQALTPDLKVAEVLELLRFILLLCLGAIGVPEHFFVEANTVNKASAGEMSAPVFARVRERQNVIKSFLQQILAFAVQSAWRAGKLADIPREELAVEVTMIDPDRRAYDTLGAALNQIADFLGKGNVSHWIDDTEAANAYRQMCSLIGVDLESQQEKQAAQGEAAVSPAPTQLDAVRAQAQQYLGQQKAAIGKSAANQDQQAA